MEFWAIAKFQQMRNKPKLTPEVDEYHQAQPKDGLKGEEFACF